MRLLLLSLPAVVVLGLFFLLPLTAVLIEGASVEVLARLWSAADLRAALGQSLLLGGFSGLLALVIGVPVAIHLTRLRPSARAWMQVVIALPLTFSGLIVAYGFILMLGRAGFITQVLAALGGDPVVIAGWFYGPLGLTLAYAYFLTPRVVLMLTPVLLNLDSAQLAAAASLGAPRWRIALDIVGPQLAPTLIAAFCLVAAVALGAYGTALALIGTQLNILPLRLYSLIADAGSDFPLAAAVSLVLLAVCSLIMAVAEMTIAQWEARHVRPH